MSDKNYVSLGKAAKVYGVSRTTILNWIKSGKIQAVKTPGNHYRVELDTIIKLREDSGSGSTKLKRIMLVDDDISSVELVGEILHDTFNNIETLSFTDGYAALIALGKNEVDLIVLDLNMPAMDGFEFTRSIRENEETKDLPIIILSAFIDEKGKENLSKYGICYFADKGKLREELITQIESIFLA